MSDLGKYISRIRRSKCFSIRELEKRTGISNAYISQIETGKVKEPSCNKLFKISEALCVPYEILMEKAGYYSPMNQSVVVTNSIGELSDEEEEKLLDYLEFIRRKRNDK